MHCPKASERHATEEIAAQCYSMTPRATFLTG